MPDANDYPIPAKEAAAVAHMERLGYEWDGTRWDAPSGLAFN